jgi:hydroxyacylglutathione hydrolase
VSYARDHLFPLVDEGLGNSAYLADLGDGRALAVDASRDLRALREAAAKRGLRVAFAADTHLHADFLSGAVQLATEDGATVLAAADGHREFPPHRTGRRGRGGSARADAARPGHARAHRRAPVLPAAGREQGAGSIHRRVADRRVGRPHRPARRQPDRTTGPRPVPVAAPAGRAAGRDRSMADARRRVVLLRPARHRPGHHHRRGEGVQPAAGRTGRGHVHPPAAGQPGSYPAYFTRLAEVNRRGPAPVTRSPGLARSPRPPSAPSWAGAAR